MYRESAVERVLKALLEQPALVVSLALLGSWARLVLMVLLV